MPEKYCFIENCRSEFPQFLVPKDKIRRKKFLEILGAPNPLGSVGPLLKISSFYGLKVIWYAWSLLTANF